MQLGESSETTRQRAKRGLLKAIQRGKGGRWFVERKSLAALVEELGRPRPRSHLDQLTDDIRRLRAEVEALRRLIERRSSPRAPKELHDERDRYRAEASRLREVAIRSNAAQQELGVALRGLGAGIEGQAAALSELLGPASPTDLGISD